MTGSTCVAASGVAPPASSAGGGSAAPARMRAKSSSTEGAPASASASSSPASPTSPTATSSASTSTSITRTAGAGPSSGVVPDDLEGLLVLVVRHFGPATEAVLLGDRHRGGPCLFVGPVEVRQDAVHPVAHSVHRRRHLVARRT